MINRSSARQQVMKSPKKKPKPTLGSGARFNSLTKKRLEKYKELGFCIVFMRVLEIKCWYGRYYWVCFKKGGKSILTF